jgi:hypothetical protein
MGFVSFLTTTYHITPVISAKFPDTVEKNLAACHTISKDLFEQVWKKLKIK